MAEANNCINPGSSPANDLYSMLYPSLPLLSVCHYTIFFNLSVSNSTNIKNIPEIN